MTDTELQMETFCALMRPADPALRAQVDVAYTWDGKTATLFAIRQQWNNPEIRHKRPLAQFRYVKSRQHWTLYWQRANGTWTAYRPYPTSPYLKELLQIVRENKDGAFDA